MVAICTVCGNGERTRVGERGRSNNGSEELFYGSLLRRVTVSSFLGRRAGVGFYIAGTRKEK